MSWNELTNKIRFKKYMDWSNVFFKRMNTYDKVDNNQIKSVFVNDLIILIFLINIFLFPIQIVEINTYKFDCKLNLM